MPDKQTMERARKDAREGKAPTTQAGEFVREEIHHVREGKHGVRSPKQAIAIGLSKARKAGVKLPPPPKGTASAQKQGRKHRSTRRNRPSAKRSRATTRALKREKRSGASHSALSRQARSASRRRGAATDQEQDAKQPVREARARGDNLPCAGQETSSAKSGRVHDAVVHVGTSGWHYKHWAGDFYPPRFPPAKMLARYAEEFQTVEINNSFYRLPEEKTFAQWARIVPPEFLFAVKASRFLTHIKRLKEPADSIQLFFSRARHLGAHFGPVLFQLPPKWKADIGRLSTFLELLPPGHQYVIEFRDESWYAPEICELLRGHNVAICLHDWRSAEWSRELTANFTYIRFHGTDGKYAGNYPDDQLQAWAERIENWSHRMTSVFAYFNNDVGGHAIRNARTLKTRLRRLATPEKTEPRADPAGSAT